MLRFLQLLARLGWPLRLLRPVLGKYNPLDPDLRVDPYPIYERLRREAPVYRHPLMPVWVLSRYQDIADVLRDPRFSVNRTLASFPGEERMFAKMPEGFVASVKKSLLMQDPPAHTRLRSLVNRAFTPRTVERLRPRIQTIVDGLLDEAAGRSEVDLVRDLAYPLPVIVIAELLGVPAEDRERFKRWSDDLAMLLDPFRAARHRAELVAAYQGLSSYFLGIFEERRREPRDDLVSALVALEKEEDSLDEAELLGLCGLILGAGHETTTGLIGNAVLALLRHPDERKRLRDDPDLIGSAVEEFLRYDSPVQVTDRVALEDMEFRGARIRRGQLVALLLGAGNRDPAVFPEPDRLDLERDDASNLAFGQGVHFCLGAALARAEAQIAIGTLVRRYPHFEGDPDPRSWKLSIVLRSLERFPLVLGEPAAAPDG